MSLKGRILGENLFAFDSGRKRGFGGSPRHPSECPPAVEGGSIQQGLSEELGPSEWARPVEKLCAPSSVARQAVQWRSEDPMIPKNQAKNPGCWRSSDPEKVQHRASCGLFLPIGSKIRIAHRGEAAPLRGKFVRLDCARL